MTKHLAILLLAVGLMLSCGKVSEKGFGLDDIHDAYELFSRQQEDVLKVGLFPAGVPKKAASRELVDAIC